jgi:hypothetical protein
MSAVCRIITVHIWQASCLHALTTHVGCRKGHDPQWEDGQAPDAAGLHDAGKPAMLSLGAAPCRMLELPVCAA